MTESAHLDDLTRAHNDAFRLLIDNIEEYAIFLLDPTGRVRTWNEGARRMKGYEPEEIIGRDFSVFFPVDAVARGLPARELEVARREGRWQGEDWRIRKDGSRFWASVVITALKRPNGELVGFGKVTRDLTERRKMETERLRLFEDEHAARQEVEATLERLRALQSVTETALAHLDLYELLAELLAKIHQLLRVDTVAVLLLDEESKMLVATAAQGLEEEVKAGVRIPLGKGFAGRVAAERRAVILDDVDHADILNPILRETGIKSMLGVPLTVEGRVIGVLHVGTLHHHKFLESDVQFLQIVADRVALAIDRARLHEQARTARIEADLAEASLRARDELVSVAAHELKTPMTSLRIAGQMLLRQMKAGRAPDIQALDKALATMDRQLGKLGRLVDQLLETVRIQSGRLRLDLEATDLSALLARMVDEARARSTRHDLVVTAPGPVWARVDPLRIEQVVNNLLDNAIKFSPEGGKVEVDIASLCPDRVTFSVRDQGIGVAPPHRDHLFERFYQAHSSDHRSGMGLGLFISREIVEAHGGTIDAEFPETGGTRLVVELPANLTVPDRVNT